MRRWPVLLLLPVLLAGCGNRREHYIAEIAASVRQFVPADRLARRAFEADMRTLLAAGQYARLAQIADSLRTTRARFGDDSYAMVSFLDAFSYNDTPQAQQSEAWLASIGQLEAWRTAMPESPLPDVALAQTFVNLAWKARGHGNSFTVRDTGWAGFEVALDRARQMLDTAARKRPLGIEWYIARGRVALGLGWPTEESEEIFRGAIACDPTCDEAYWRRADFLLPRWYGAPGEWEAWLDQALATLPPDEADRIYAAVCTEMSICHQNLFRECKVSWPRFQRGLRIQLARHPRSEALAQRFAFNASVASDAGAAVEMFRRTGPRCEIELWRNKRNFASMWVWAHAMAARNAQVRTAAAK
jgi:hypothetical protein